METIEWICPNCKTKYNKYKFKKTVYDIEYLFCKNCKNYYDKKLENITNEMENLCYQLSCWDSNLTL